MKVFCWSLCLLALLSKSVSIKLTKEIKIADKTDKFKTSQKTFLEAVEALKHHDIHQEITKLLFNTTDKFRENLAEYLSTSEQKKASEIIDIFNDGLGISLLACQDDYIHVNFTVFEGILTKTASSLFRSVLSRDYSHQEARILQTRISERVQFAYPLIAEQRISTGQLELLLAGERQVDKRDIYLRTNLLTTICQSAVSASYSVFNSTMSTLESFVENIEVSKSENNLLSAVAAAFFKMVIEIAEYVLSAINETVYSLSTSVCSSIFESSSRRKREVPQNKLGRMVNETHLGILERRLATRGVIDSVFNTLWNLVSTALNSGLSSLLNAGLTQLQSVIDDFINDTIGEYLLSVVEYMFPS